MYNSEKQARAAGGRFGGKVVNAERVADDVQQLGADVGELLVDAATMVERGGAALVEKASDLIDNGETFMVEYEQKAGIPGWAILAVLVAVVAVLLFAV